ncbi:glycosyltransferase WbsX family protein [Allobaculum fili]|uniref:glycosyltransferase WbsX family protein n=1 Tax=Allobaculum fili TaxID=2834460 RepID=UPI001E47FE1D|nr:glycoside hydrolase family 99-like domain-containing protein [Allobaculum fili]
MKKIIALYLPQFHRIPENDEWWGPGFTDWVNVKKAVPLFKGHLQPRVPLNHNYYDLSDPKVLADQSSLALAYGIDGFCFYHYWFNGKLLLEKPVEQLLTNTDVKIPFMFSWANETWARTWDGREKNILIQQEYGGEKDWESHLQYFLPFFKDERYIKIDNKPVLLLYTSSRIQNCAEMVDFWNRRLREYGFDGIYILETLNYIQPKPVLPNAAGTMTFEPVYTFSNEMKKQSLPAKIDRFLKVNMNLHKLTKYDSKSVFENIANRSQPENNNPSVCVGWDNTARKGKNGSVMVDNDPQYFKDTLHKLMTEDTTGPFVFINAWNEWAEGTYLEPDNFYGTRYLEIIEQEKQREKTNDEKTEKPKI